MSMEIIVRRIAVHYDGYSEDHWLLFESGHLSQPLVILTTFEMQRLVEQYKAAIKEREKYIEHR